MDAGDLIYFAIIIIGLISGFLKKKKKNAEQGKKQKSTLEDILQGFTGQEPEPKSYTEPEPVFETSYNEPEYTSPKSPSPHVDDLEHSEKTASQIIKEHQAKFRSKDKSITENSPEDSIDLKQAIIYNTILNRPEY